MTKAELVGFFTDYSNDLDVKLCVNGVVADLETIHLTKDGDYEYLLLEGVK